MFYSEKRVLVAGGTGMVGSALVQRLLDSGARVRVVVHKRPLRDIDKRAEYISADLMNQDECQTAFRGIEYVFQAAGVVGAAGVTAEQSMPGFITNLILTARMLQAAWAERVERFLLFSSSTVYPPIDHALEEGDAWKGDPYPGYFGYSWMRRYLERLGEFVATHSATAVIVVRPTAAYGRGDQSDHVIPSLIRRAFLKESPYVVWGTGDEVRDFLHSTDLAAGALLAMEKGKSGDPINLGSGKPTTIRDLVQIVLDASGHQNVQVVFDPYKPVAIPFRTLDITKAKRDFGFEPKVSLRDGIKDFIEWRARIT